MIGLLTLHGLSAERCKMVLILAQVTSRGLHQNLRTSHVEYHKALLFIVYITDMPEAVYSKCLLHACDSAKLVSGKDVKRTLV